MIEEDARAGKAGISAEVEIADLKKDHEVPIEVLRAMYANMPEQFSDEESDDFANDDGKDLRDQITSTTAQTLEVIDAKTTSKMNVDGEGSNADEEVGDEDDDDEFIAMEEQDDETTMIEEEAKGGGPSAQEELEELQRDNEMPIEQLRAMYANMPDTFSDEDDEDEDEDDDEDEGQDETLDNQKESSADNVNGVKCKLMMEAE